MRGVLGAERPIGPGAESRAVEWAVLDELGWPDRGIAGLVGRQRALVTRRQLLALGIESSMITRALRRGRLHRVHQGIYSLVPLPALPPLALELAAVLACGDAALLSHHSAAAVWGFGRSFNGDVDVTVVGGDCGRTRNGIRVHRVSELDPRDVRRYQGIPITSPARALLEIAPDLTDRQLERALDEALDQARDHPRRDRRGPRRLPTPPRRRPPQSGSRPRPPHHRDALRRRGSPARADPQSRSPPPELNAKVGNYTADFLWRDQKVIVELDGYDYHRGRAAFERDHQRDAEHQRMDHLVIRITGRQLARQPEAILVRIATALATRRSAAA